MNKSRIVWLIAIVLCLGTCTKHDKDFNDVTPPVIAPVYAITGHVTDYQGHVLANATVQTTEGLSVKADKNGIYFMEMPVSESSTKTYTLTASYEGKKDVSRNITLAKQEGCLIAHQDFRLPSSTVITFFGGNEGNVYNEYLDNNDLAKTLVGACIEGHEDEVFQLELFYYNEDFGANPESTDPVNGTFEKDKLFFATKVTSAEGEKKDKDDVQYILFFDFDTKTQDNTIIRSFSNGRWSDVPESQMAHESNRMTVNDAKLGVVYAAFCPTTITITHEEIPLECNPSEVDNTYGTETIIVPYTEFNYKVGVDLEKPAHCQLQALLLEVLAREYGSASHEVTYRWYFNDNSKLGIEIIVGIVLGIAVAGGVIMVKLKSALGNPMTGEGATGRIYGPIRGELDFSNAGHTGGGSKP